MMKFRFFNKSREDTHRNPIFEGNVWGIDVSCFSLHTNLVKLSIRYQWVHSHSAGHADEKDKKQTM